MTWFVVAVVLVGAAGLLLWLVSRLYRTSSREIAMIRTGFGGMTAVLDGGCLVLPFIHRVTEVNMKTLRMEVSRSGNQSLITKDRLRVDIRAEFYLRVRPDADGVATAAQALGGKTFRSAELGEILEGKLIDALQSVVASSELDQLHENRSQFVAQVSDAVRANLARNGLDLEAVSLTNLDQTPFAALDENNAFNAVGMRQLAEIIASNKKKRAAIEADADTAVRQRHLEAEKQRHAIESEQRQSEIEQQLNLHSMQAEQQARSAELDAAADRRAEAARIDQQRQRQELQLASDLQTSLAEQQNQIDLNRKTIEVTQAQIEADHSRADAETASQLIATARAKTIAERSREIAQIRLQEQQDSSRMRRQSAAESVQMQAEAEAAAQRLRAAALQVQLEAQAKGEHARALAENALSAPAAELRLQQHKLDTLPRLAAEMVKPAEKIEGIRIHQISGLGAGTGSTQDKPAINQAIDGMLGMAMQLPALQQLGKELGINLTKGFGDLAQYSSPQTPPPPAGEQPDATTDHNSMNS